MSKLSITNVGPVAQFEGEIEGAGVYLLAGPNGSGKTYTQRAIQALATGSDSSLEVNRDADEDERGLVEGFGARFVVGRRRGDATDEPRGRNSGTGALELRAVEGFDIWQLIDPGIKDPVSADAARAASICKLARIPTSIDLFVDALGPTVARLSTRKTQEEATLPGMARGVARDLQAEARVREDKLARVDGEIDAHLRDSDGVDADATPTLYNWNTEIEAAVEAKQALVAQAREAAKVKEAAARARAAFEGATNVEALPSIAARRDAAREAVQVYERQIADLQSQLNRSRERLAACEAEYNAAENTAKSLAAWRAQIEAGESVHVPSEEELAAASERIAKAQAGQRDEADMLRKIKSARAAKALLAQRDALSKEAAEIRAMAEKCDAVVSSVLSKHAPHGLRMKNDRLVLDVNGRETLLSDLSVGQMVRVIASIAKKSAGNGRALLILSREAWAALDEAGKREVAKACEEGDVVCIAAQPSDGELRIEKYTHSA